MNQHAVVLAADSATTVQMWVDGERENRYFKGSNKLFQISATQPVGLMIYGSASLHDVPWELLIKDFRKSLQSDAFDQLSGYSKRFFDFVKGHTLFTEELRRESFLDEAIRAAHINLKSASEDKSVTEADDNAKVAALRGSLERMRDGLGTKTPKAPVTPADVDAAIAAHADTLSAKIRGTKALVPLADGALVPLLAELAIRDLMANYADYLTDTGVVIGGYGELDYFPGWESYRCYGFLDRLFIANPEGNPKKVSKDLPAWIEPFATTSMIDNFRLGIAPDVFTEVQLATRKELGAFAKKMQAALAPDQPPPNNLQTLIDDAVRSHTKEWVSLSMRDHFGPLARVIGSLPISDMAALARSLIELQSLKERVTKPTESVSGPIDVAVISKHDGFVWIDRKHYFKAELNPRFFSRQRLGGPAT
jgi:hypothetical protein